MFIIQCRDLEEGAGALWRDVQNSRFEFKHEAIRMALALRKQHGTMCHYRVVEEGSDEAFSQPTDRLEY